MAMIDIEELDRLVKAEFANDELVLKEWDKKKWYLEYDFSEECMDGDRYEVVVSGGYFETYIDELAYFLWKCGCGLCTTTDYWDGSDTFTVSNPETDKERAENIEEGTKFWQEAFEE